MPLVLTETKTTAYPNGWKTVTTNKCQHNEYSTTTTTATTTAV